MNYSKEYYQTYQGIPEELPKLYPDLSFDNHCYLRIGLDHLFQNKWDLKLKRPAYKNLTKEQLNKLIQVLEKYKSDKQLLLKHNKESLGFRGKAN